ncbi:MAG: deoxyribose-phosphate aldolase [Bacilli bacterium]|nr:deoxyribose-phosphate aldolase [Bacilli bacterium]
MNEYFDSTMLKAISTTSDIKKLCSDAKKYKFKAVCINPCYVSLAKELLKDTNVKVCTVIGFPLGANTTYIKVEEVRDAINNGADEVDMVINVGALKEKNYDYVINEIKELRNVSHNKILKVIIETCYLTEEEIIKMTEICNDTNVDFIKTSTGFGTRGASIEDIEIINKYKSNDLKIKASGGIRNKVDAQKYIELGVSRIGTSNAVKMMEE